MIVGMDFGTTNSGMAVYDGRDVRRLPLDPSNDNPRIARTALYVTNEQDIFIGREAVDRYFEHNVGRPVKLQKVWVGEIEVIADLVYFVQDAYVWADVMSPGRLFLSFKSNLRDQEYTGTVIGQFFYPLEAMVALYFYVTKKRAEEILGRELREVTLGRPVHFAEDREHDNLAQERLLRGAFQAGYERVYLQREPVAAAYHYARLADEPQNIVVFDFGGGTLDITVMRLETDHGTRRVLATGGVPIAGDVFDRKLVRARLPRHFGEDSRYGAKSLPIPTWIYDTFSNWQTILELQSPENRRVLQEIERTAQRPREIRALNSLVAGNYGLQMFDEVEKTKRDLSERFGGMIRLSGPDFDVMELVTRRDFENIIRPEYLRIERELDETLKASGLETSQIDAAIRTGGSAEIPLFQQLLHEKFGVDRVHSTDTFGSVTAGLSILAHGIAQGEIEARAYTPQDLKKQDVTVSRPNVSVVDLRLLKRRMEAQSLNEEEREDDGGRAFVLLSGDQRLLAQPLDEGAEHAGAALVGRLAQQETPQVAAAFTASLDEPLLLVTSRYRFVLSSARQLLDLEALGQSLAELHHFAPRERIFAFNCWRTIKDSERLLLATSVGYVRGYPTDVIRAAIEAPVPLTFEQPLPGWPIAVMGANGNEQCAMLTTNGRGLRRAVGEIPGIGMQLLKRDEDDVIVAVLTGDMDEDLLLVTAAGFARRLPLGDLVSVPKANHRGRQVITRRPLRAAVPVDQHDQARLLTSKGLHKIDSERVPCETGSTRSHRLLRLETGEDVLQVI